MGKTSAAVKKRYNAKAYDRIQFVVPKGMKNMIEAHTKEKGKSVNGLIGVLLRADMDITDEEWKRSTEEDVGRHKTAKQRPLFVLVHRVIAPDTNWK